MRNLFNTDYVVYDKGNDHILRWETSGDMIVFGDKEEAIENCCRNEDVIRCTELSAHHKKELINQINNKVMTEMEQEKRASLHADVMLRLALDVRRNDNVLIAEFMELPTETMGVNATIVYGINQDDWYTADNLNYSKSWDWLIPVCRKIDEKLSDNRLNLGYFDECLTSNDLEVRFQAVVEFINQLNK